MRDASGLRSLLDRAAATLGAAGIDDGRRESAALLASLMGRPVLDLLVGFGDPPSAAQRERFEALVRRRAERVPLQILTGRVGFHALELETAPGVFVPRPETELLVDLLCAHVEASGVRSPQLVEVGTGTGAISIATLERLPRARGLATDLSPEALSLAARNARTAGVSDRLTLLRADMLDTLRPGARFDVLASNPPYVPTAVIDTLEAEVRDHDPRLALDGGADGLTAYRRLAERALALLAPRGLAIFEIGTEQGDAVRRILVGAGFARVEIRRDLADRPRIAIAHAA